MILFIFKAEFIFLCLNWCFKTIVIFLISILTICFLLVADVVALVIYPFWAWKHPEKAAQFVSLVDIIGWQWLDDFVEPCKLKKSDDMILRFFQCIMRPIDAAAVKLWNAWFLHHSPISKRKYFINVLGDELQSLPAKVQENYFCYGVDFDRQVYLVKNNMLSPEVLKKLRPCDEVLVAAGKISDAQFSNLNAKLVAEYAKTFDLSIPKQVYLMSQLFYAPETYLPILREYIMRKGLHPKAVEYFYNTLKEVEKLKAGVEELPKILQARQDLVTVLNMVPEANVESFGSHLHLYKFSKYLNQRNALGYNAQVAMTSAQYKIFHEQGLKMQDKAVCEKLAMVNKNAEAQQFVALMMRFGECDGNEVAQSQIAADKKLSALWLNHLAEHDEQTA